jgi:hypothetical protein
MMTLIFTFCYLGFDQIAGLKAKGSLGMHQITSGKSILVYPGPLMATSPSTLDDHNRFFPIGNLAKMSHAGGIQGLQF